MAEQLWRRCPDCNGEGTVTTMDGLGREDTWPCRRDLGFVPVAAGALLIEQVPYRRALAVVALVAHGTPAMEAIDIVDEVLSEMTKPLPAAVGEQPEGRG